MRRIFKINDSYMNRVTSHDFGVQSNSIRLSSQFLRHQMMVYGRISSLRADHVLRKPTLNIDSLIRVTNQAKWPHGTPIAQCANCVFNYIMHVSRSFGHFMHTFTTGDRKDHVCKSMECLHARNIDWSNDVYLNHLFVHMSFAGVSRSRMARA